MKSILLFALSLCYSLTIGAQTIYYVKSGGSGTKTGDSWENALNNIQSAIEIAVPGDQIWVAAGKFYGNSNSDYSIILKDGVALYGGFAGTESKISDRLPGNITQLQGDYTLPNNNNATVVATNISQATVLDGFTIKPNQSNGPHCRGMYLKNVSDNLMINHCIIDGNTTSGSSSVTPQSGYGAGIYIDSNSHMEISNCIISNNSGQNYGGGVYMVSSSPKFTCCQFIQNSALKTGGGAYNVNSSAVYKNCLFKGNQTKANGSNYGGGTAFVGSTGSPKLINCLIAQNTSSTFGAGIYCSEAELSIINCTITDNNTINAAGGAGIFCSETGSNTLSIANSIIWNNISENADASTSLDEITIQFVSASPIVTNNLIKNGQYGSISDDPKFMDPDNGNFQLQSESPAIDAGDNNAGGFVVSDTDLIGNHRIINQTVDLGAYETLTDKINNNGQSSFKGFSGSLDITGNPYENDQENTYKWKMIISSASVNDILLVDPNELAGYSGLLATQGIIFDSTHFQVTDLSVMPMLLSIITGESGWDNFNGDIFISRAVYPNQQATDTLISNTINITIASALPVTIKDFAGQLQHASASLTWHTATESGFDHFELEKSLDGENFVHVSSIAAKGDNSNYQQRVSQTEQKAYYRLKIVEKDGSVSFYKQVLTLVQQTDVQLSIYPNPATTVIHVKVDRSRSFSLFDGAGRKVKSGKLKAGINDIDITHLHKGIYFGEIDGLGRFKVFKK